MNNLSIIDGDSIIYLSCYNKDMELFTKTHNDVFKCIDNYIKDILVKTESIHYTGFLSDGSFRYDIAKQKPYKGNRSTLEKPKYFSLAKSYLIDEYKFKIVKPYEADDLCIMSATTLNSLGEYNPIICTPDKDLKQIAGTFYNYKKQELVTITREEAYKNLWRQVLTGDSGDNIQGVKGLGDVRANKILENSKDYASTVLQVYMDYYGEYKGILAYTENYQLVKMIDTEYNPDIHIKEYCDDLIEW